MILHIPHSSYNIPSALRDQIILDDKSLNAELLRMTDAYTDELFYSPGAVTVCFPISRLLVDVERFRDDAREHMSSVGMGVIYTSTSDQRPLRRALSCSGRHLLQVQHGILD